VANTSKVTHVNKGELQVDFVDWCDVVLSKSIELAETSPEARRLGFVSVHLLASEMFGKVTAEQQFFRETGQGRALLGAVEALESVGLVSTKRPGSAINIEVTQLGRSYVDDPLPVWEEICKVQLNSEQAHLLGFVNQLSPRRGKNFVWLEWISRETVAASDWGDKDRFIPAQRELRKLDLIRSSPNLGSDLDLKATYRGLVWETRPSLIRRLKDKKEGVFISHINEESRMAQGVKSLLREAFGPDLRVFVSSDYESLRGGDKWFPTILANLKSTRVILVLLSKNSLYRPWVPYEAGVGEGAGAKVIPMVHMDFSLRELGPPLGEYHVRRLQSEDGVRALIEDVKVEIGLDVSEVNVAAFVAGVEALGREAAYGVNEPGRELVRTWIESVITPVIRTLEGEQQLLEVRRLRWEEKWNRLEGVSAIRDSLDPGWLDRLEQFERFDPDITELIDEHDREAATLQEQYRHLFESIQDDSQVHAIYERAVSPESLTKMGAKMSDIFITEDINQNLKYLAAHTINRAKRLPSGYTTEKLWERFGGEFLDVLNHPPLKELVEEADATAGRLLQVTKQLISRLKEIRETLSLKHNVSY